MLSILSPALAALVTGLVALILRYTEKKILKLDAEKASEKIAEAQSLAQNPEVKNKLREAQANLTNIKSNTNGSFAKKTAIIIITWLTLCGTATAQRIETNISYITTTAATDTVLLTFTIYNDDTTAFYLGNVLISISANWAQCNNGHNVRASKPAIADTSIHVSQQPYVLSSNGQFSINYIFRTGNRLLCPALASTTIGTDTLFIPTATAECTYNQIYSSSQLPSFLQTSTGESSNLSFKREWWRWFITH